MLRGVASARRLPVNLDPADRALFEHELERAIPSTILLRLRNVTVNPAGILSSGGKVLPESFPSPHFMDERGGLGAQLRLGVKNYLLRFRGSVEQDGFWFTDVWSREYFHWMTDALPRLFTIRDRVGDATLLLPGAYAGVDYIQSSLKPFSIRNLKFVNEPLYCKNLYMPSHTAPTGNYNETVIRSLRSFFIDNYRDARGGGFGDKIYISRGKADKRRIVNEEECVEVLEDYGFKSVYFEDHSFEEQVKIAMDAKYLISNHGAGLTNIMFMESGGGVLELRRKGDAHNNCYFALASAVQLQYFYQLCPSDSPVDGAEAANLIVDCEMLRKNIEHLLGTSRAAD